MPREASTAATLGSPSAVDVAETIGLRERCRCGIRSQNLIKQPLPRRLVEAGRVSQHALEVEHARFEEQIG